MVEQTTRSYIWWVNHAPQDGTEGGAHRVNSVPKAIEEKQFPLEGRHADFVDGRVDEGHFPGKNWVDVRGVVYVGRGAGFLGAAVILKGAG